MPSLEQQRRAAPLSDHPVQRTVPANSVFAMGQQARSETPSPSKQKREPIDMAKVPAYKDRPLPAPRFGGISTFATIFEQKLPHAGASVDLTRTQAKSMLSWGKKNGKKLAIRELGPDLFGIWRLE